MKKVILSLVQIFVFLNFLTFAQELKTFGGGGYFATGLNFLNIKDFNNVLRQNGYAEFSSVFITIGGAGYGQIGKFLIGGEGARILQKKSESNVRNLTLSGGYGLFKLGYVLSQKNNLFAYLYTGIGGGGINFKIFENQVINFNNALVNPNKVFDANASSLIFDVGFSSEYRFKRQGGFMVGIKVGYLFSPVAGDWKMAGEVRISDGPKAGVDGFYIQIIFGGFGFSKVERKR